MKKSILLIDDDRDVAKVMREWFLRNGWVVSVAADGLQGLQEYQARRPDVVLLDIGMPGISGLDVLHVILERHEDATVVMLTGNADVDMAVSAMRAGAENFLTKPLDLEHLAAAVDRAHEKAELKKRARWLAQQQTEDVRSSSFERSPVMRDISRQVTLLASGSAPILLLGETGTGKGWLARLIHSGSPRSGGPFVSINCAGLNAEFLDTELFGQENGASTERRQAKEGLFDVADGGTIFLDEVGDLAPGLQPKLLSVLETGRFRRPGGTAEREVDVRVIAATHRDLSAAVAAGGFREDLYYRLAVLPIKLPALRERGDEEVAALAAELTSELTRKSGRGPIIMSADALRHLIDYRWPGNIRELRNVLERAILLAGDAPTLLPRHLPLDLRPRAAEKRAPRLAGDLSLKSAERMHIQRVLDQVKGNRARAARELGIPRSTLYKKLQEYGALI
jgi:DNA-binding NtrC family response regulator